MSASAANKKAVVCWTGSDLILLLSLRLTPLMVAHCDSELDGRTFALTCWAASDLTLLVSSLLAPLMTPDARHYQCTLQQHWCEFVCVFN